MAHTGNYNTSNFNSLVFLRESVQRQQKSYTPLLPLKLMTIFPPTSIGAYYEKVYII